MDMGQGGVLFNYPKKFDFVFFSFPWNYMHCEKRLMKRIFIANFYYYVLSFLKICCTWKIRTKCRTRFLNISK